eukprot:3432014-Rhodomonas_salina.2
MFLATSHPTKGCSAVRIPSCSDMAVALPGTDSASTHSKSLWFGILSSDTLVLPFSELTRLSDPYGMSCPVPTQRRCLQGSFLGVPLADFIETSPVSVSALLNLVWSCYAKPSPTSLPPTRSPLASLPHCLPSLDFEGGCMSERSSAFFRKEMRTIRLYAD